MAWLIRMSVADWGKPSFSIDGIWDNEVYRKQFLDGPLSFYWGNSFLGDMPRLVAADVTPRHIATASRSKRFPHFMLFSTVWLVSEDVRLLVEEFEPGVHQFIPVDLRFRDGSPAERPYCYLNVTQMFDAVIVAKSAVKWDILEASCDRRFDLPMLKPDDPMKPPALVMSRPEIAGRHLWRSDRLPPGARFVSDALMTEFKQRGHLSYTNHFPVAEVDEPWDRDINLGPLPAYYARRHEIIKESDRAPD